MRTNNSMLLLILWFYSVAAIAAEDCSGTITDSLEKVYCQLQQSGQGAGLPSLRDFRRNPPKTQRLLLQRPAERAGIVLPQGQKSAPQPAHVPAADADATPDAMAACEINTGAIICGHRRYVLLDNLPNSRLDPAALTKDNQLRLPSFSGSVNDREQLMGYLDQSYQLYLEAMISIGLAASTMSFTKFYHTFMDVQASGADFTGRMATMFEYLKKDKKAMAVRPQLTPQRPVNLRQCRMLNPELTVCDDVKHNWLYRQVQR